MGAAGIASVSKTRGALIGDSLIVISFRQGSLESYVAMHQGDPIFIDCFWLGCRADYIALWNFRCLVNLLLDFIRITYPTYTMLFQLSNS